MLNYKSVIKSRTLRVRILSFLNWIPDKIMVRIQYWMQTGRWPDLKNPKRFTEKLQIYKMHYRNPDMLRCTDKYEVREYVQEKGCDKYLIPLIGVFEHVDDIDFDSLPDRFVAKSTDGGGGNQVFVCKNKNLLSVEDFKQSIDGWMRMCKASKHAGREWAYNNNFARRIVIEEYVGKPNEDLIDYKFFCFYGKVKYIYGISDRIVGQSAKFGIYDKDFKKLNVSRNDERIQDRALPKPDNFNEMITLAERLSCDFPHVRVDLYNTRDNIYFGELTFYDGSGYMSFTPDSFDETLGDEFDISSFHILSYHKDS